jgi:hypothetical protein
MHRKREKERDGGRERGRRNQLLAVFRTSPVLKHEIHDRVKAAKNGHCNERRYRTTLAAQGGGVERAKEH